MKKVTNKELQKDVVSMYNATKQTVENMLFTLWKYIEWKGDKEDKSAKTIRKRKKICTP